MKKLWSFMKRLPKFRRRIFLIFCFVSAYLMYKNVLFDSEEKQIRISKMDHSHHDHSMMDSVMPGHSHGGGEDEMECDTMHAMVFHAGVCQYILFPGWVSTTAGELFGACVVVFLAALLYEGLRAWRDVLFRRGAQTSQGTSQVNITKQECGPDSNCQGQKIVKYNMLSCMHVIQTCLHMLQVFMSYLLMLIFMTYNVWLCLALILGTGLGYFLFAWKKQSIVDLTEHCH